ncbi:MAG: hypothetical protein H6R04_328 [Burkholderiaceae bacterium]|nr:hypothetical protein [Burkholderiaceae bacterium]
MSSSHVFLLKRVYDPAAPQDGKRFLVDRLWPRGMRKEKLLIDGWLKDVAPSPALRTWFDHKAENFSEFSARYREELAQHPAACEPLLQAIESGNVTLLYAAKDPDINHAVVLRDYLQKKRRAARR